MRPIAYFLAACVILAAAAVLLSRALVPVLDNHKADFEKWAGDLLGYPVKIEKVRLGWYQYQPEITLRRVAILDKTTQAPLQKIKRVSIFLSLPQSLWQRKPVASGLMLSGAAVSVEQSDSGEYTLKGLSFDGLTDQSTEVSKTTEALNWLSHQPRLILRNVDVHFSDAQKKEYDLTLADLRFENDQTNHDVIGKAILHQALPTKVDIAIKWQGPDLDLNKIQANIYLYVSGFLATGWQKNLPSWLDWHLEQGIISAKIWGSWDQGTFTKLQSNFQAYDLILHSNIDNLAHKVTRIRGNVGWKREGTGQVIAGNDILIDLPQHLWPITNFYLVLKADTTGALMPATLNIGYVDLSDIQTFLFASPAMIAPETQKILKQLALKGSLQNASVAFAAPWTDWQHLALEGTLNHVSVTSYEKLPGIDNLSAKVKWKNAQGLLTLQTQQGVLHLDSVFANPIDIAQLTGDVHIAMPSDGNWQLTTQNVHLANQDLTADVKGSLINSPESPLEADITATFALQQAKKVAKYLPLKHFDRPLNKWLTTSFFSGYVKNGQAILRGPLKDYPFDQGNGLFSISGDVRGVDFQFAANWPMLEGVDAKLTFAGRQIVVDAERATTLGVNLGKMHAVIPYLGDAHPQILQIDSVNDVQANFKQAFAYVHASPLKKNIGKMFSGIVFSGPLSLKLGLTIPLNDPDHTAVKGALNITNAEMDLVPWKLKIDHLTGLVHFTDKTTTADNLQAELFNQPLTFSLASVQKTKTISVVRATIANRISIADLESWLKIPFSNVVTGATDIIGDLDFSLDTPMEIHLRSDLVGINIDLPDQYGKKADVKRAFTADLTIQDNQPVKAQMRYGDLLGAALVLEKKNNTFELSAANLRLGTGVATFPPTDGLYITGEWGELDWDKVKGYMNQSGASKFPANFLKKIDLDIKSANLFGQQLSPLHIEATPSQNTWEVDIDSPGISGEITFPAHFSSRGSITADFQQLRLNTPSGSQTKLDVAVNTLPSISFRAKSVQFGTLSLGQVTFKTSPASGGLRIEALRISSQYSNLQASGNWIQAGGRYTTQLQGVASSTNVSALLSSYGFDVHNFIANKGQVDFQLAWADAPFAPSLASLNGKATLDISKGRIIDVGQTSGAKMDLGRMLSLFSLQTIPRRLSLDFSDLFQKGYSFDYLKGNFDFQNGNLLTTDTRFEGPVAKVGIDGRIGLVKKDYDLHLSITPYIASSIPVAAALVTLNPLVGVGAYAVSKVVGSAITYHYSVTGPWNQPVWNSR